MPEVTLQPLAKHEGAMLSYLDINFRRLSDALGSLGQVEQGTLLVTGGVQIDTGIANVLNVFVTLADVPVAGACFVYGELVGPTFPRDILIGIYTNTFAVSTLPKMLSWLAIGEP